MMRKERSGWQRSKGDAVWDYEIRWKGVGWGYEGKWRSKMLGYISMRLGCVDT